MKKRFFVAACAAVMTMGCVMTVSAAEMPKPAYFFGFDNQDYASTGSVEDATATQVGSGVVEYDEARRLIKPSVSSAKITLG